MADDRLFGKIQNDSQELVDFILEKLHKEPDSIYVLMTYLLAECGEVADKARALDGNRVESSHITKDDLAKELVDVVYNVMSLANRYDIKLDDYWTERLEMIKTKFE